ncbi:chloride transporter, chloride channel (ClC) family protein [Besnoitia besnoiti]|uniref:Chloride transporter, chloride channel (ClC) family protein n=1 Tax=Besnoitia besnoiti TaxID=94643 RepID=A0A2A9M0C4_BESBE|nr:chloride transporter, chloride channel (ClC) family protein [Besnoitia besnoiti]PFH32048.1 chloride transporter, chloride channel (ClC) family protein [Besnoitia besnoiti]
MTISSQNSREPTSSPDHGVSRELPLLEKADAPGADSRVSASFCPDSPSRGSRAVAPCRQPCSSAYLKLPTPSSQCSFSSSASFLPHPQAAAASRGRRKSPPRVLRPPPSSFSRWRVPHTRLRDELQQPRHLPFFLWHDGDGGAACAAGSGSANASHPGAREQEASFFPLRLEMGFDVDAPAPCSPALIPVTSSYVSGLSGADEGCGIHRSRFRLFGWQAEEGAGERRRSLDTVPPLAFPARAADAHAGGFTAGGRRSKSSRRLSNIYQRLTLDAGFSDDSATGLSPRLSGEEGEGGARKAGGGRVFLRRLLRLRHGAAFGGTLRTESRESAAHVTQAGWTGWFSGLIFGRTPEASSPASLRTQLANMCSQCSRVWRSLSTDRYSGAHALSVNIVDLYAAYDEVHEAPHSANPRAEVATARSPRSAAGHADPAARAAGSHSPEEDSMPLSPEGKTPSAGSRPVGGPRGLCAGGRRCLLDGRALPGGESVSFWMALVFIGVLTALVSYFLDWVVDFVLLPLQENSIQRHSYAAILAYSVACAVVAAGCCLLVPQSQGSGIPELRTILSGSFIPRFFSFPTFFARCIGLLSCICGGLSVGKEGPFVHLSSIIATQLCRLVPCFRALVDSPSKLLSVLDVAVAAGVTATFGTPFGGVLFSIEVTATFFLVHALWKSYFCCIFCVLTFRLLHETFSPIEQLYQGAQLPAFDLSWEILNFALLGAICGCLGGTFVWSASKVLQLARRHAYTTGLRKIFFVCAVMLLLNLISNHSVVLKSEDRLKLGEFFDVENLNRDRWGCHELLSLALFAVFKFAATILSVACPVPAGVFTPIFVCGAALGRLYGSVLHRFRPSLSSPAAYALVGAASLAAGTTRTISVSVIVFELTGKLSHMIPVLLSVLMAYGVNSFFTISVYDVMLLIKDLPYVPKLKSKYAYNLQAKDIVAAAAYSRSQAAWRARRGEERRGWRSTGAVELQDVGGSGPGKAGAPQPNICGATSPPHAWRHDEAQREGCRRDSADSCGAEKTDKGAKDRAAAARRREDQAATRLDFVTASAGSASGVPAIQRGQRRVGCQGQGFLSPRQNEESSVIQVEEDVRQGERGFALSDVFVPPAEQDEEAETFVVALDKENGTVLDLILCRLLYSGVAVPVVSSVARPRVDGALSLAALDGYLSSLRLSFSATAPSPSSLAFSPLARSHSRYVGALLQKRKRNSLKKLGKKVRKLLLSPGSAPRHATPRRRRLRRRRRDSLGEESEGGGDAPVASADDRWGCGQSLDREWQGETEGGDERKTEEARTYELSPDRDEAEDCEGELLQPAGDGEADGSEKRENSSISDVYEAADESEGEGEDTKPRSDLIRRSVSPPEEARLSRGAEEDSGYQKRKRRSCGRRQREATSGRMSPSRPPSAQSCRAARRGAPTFLAASPSPPESSFSMASSELRNGSQASLCLNSAGSSSSSLGGMSVFHQTHPDAASLRPRSPGRSPPGRDNASSSRGDPVCRRAGLRRETPENRNHVDRQATEGDAESGERGGFRKAPTREDEENARALDALVWRVLGHMLCVCSPSEMLYLDSLPIDWGRLEIDAAPLCVLPETPVSKIHFMFTMLFLGQVFVSDNEGLLVGVITKQSLLHADNAVHSSLGGSRTRRSSSGPVWETFQLFTLLKGEVARLFSLELRGHGGGQGEEAHARAGTEAVRVSYARGRE